MDSQSENSIIRSGTIVPEFADAFKRHLMTICDTNSIEELVEYMAEQPIAPVQDLETGVTRISDKRHVNRRTFGSETAGLLGYIYNILDEFIPGYELDIEASHSDLLLYRADESGRHGWHIDTVPERPSGIPENAVWHTFIVCLASNVSDPDDGCTVIGTPDGPVTFPTNIPGMGLLFKSTEPHMVNPVVARENPWTIVTRNTRGKPSHVPDVINTGYVLKFKCDVWITPYDAFETYDLSYGVSSTSCDEEEEEEWDEQEHELEEEELEPWWEREGYDSEPWWSKEGYASEIDACNGYFD